MRATPKTSKNHGQQRPTHAIVGNSGAQAAVASRGLATLGPINEADFPPKFTKLEPVSLQYAEAAWSVASRLAVSLRLAFSFKMLAEEGQTLPKDVDNKLTKVFPELSGLNAVLTHLGTVPVNDRYTNTSNSGSSIQSVDVDRMIETIVQLVKRCARNAVQFGVVKNVPTRETGAAPWDNLTLWNEPDYAPTELRLPSGTRIKLDPYRHLLSNPCNEDLQMVLDQTMAFLESLSDEPLLALGTIPNVPVSALAARDPIPFRPPGGRKVNRKAVGRPTYYSDELDMRLARNWESAKGMKVKKREFARTCHARGSDGECMPEKEILKAIDRGQYKLKRPGKARE